MKRSEIVEEARKHVAAKARWRKMGRRPNGMDCYGLVVLVRAAFGLKSEDWERYTNYPDADLFMEPGKRMFTQVHPPLKDGQLIIFQNGNRPCHLGITATDHYGRRSIIHCAANNKWALEEAYEPTLSKHFRAVFDFPGVED